MKDDTKKKNRRIKSERLEQSENRKEEYIRISKRPLETLIPWLGDWREFLQRAYNPLYIRVGAAKLIQAEVHLGPAAEDREDPSLLKTDEEEKFFMKDNGGNASQVSTNCRGLDFSYMLSNLC